MQLFRLKNEAKPFFDKQFKDKVKTMKYWIENHVSESALEPIKHIWVSYGHATNGGASLCGWARDGDVSNDQARFHFTLNAIGVDNDIYKKLSKEDSIERVRIEIENIFSNEIYFLKSNDK